MPLSIRQILGTPLLHSRPMSGFYTPNREALIAPLANGSILRGFCAGCGQYWDIPESGRRAFKDAYGIVIPLQPTDVYLHAAGCTFCEKYFRDLAILPIPLARR